MGLEFTHTSNYFLFAQLFVRYVQQHLNSQSASTMTIPLDVLEKVFQNDTASATTNLDSILNIADEYKVETLNGDQKIIQSYSIDPALQQLVLTLNADAIQSLNEGKPVIEPDASDYT